MNSSYTSLGASATKDDVHSAIKNQSKGLFPGAFCKINEDFLGDEEYCSVMHADGAGTKSIIAYLYYKETGDISVFRGIAQDSLVMNTDDLLCIGACEKYLMSNTIGRNAHRVGGDIIREIIEGYDEFCSTMRAFGIEIIQTGGETADVGDIIGTVIVDSTLFSRIRRDKVINCVNIKPGDLIVGCASFGKAVYEKKYNSGIASNGLTAARHLLLSDYYAKKYPESFSTTIEKGNYYSGKYKLGEQLDENLTIGEAILSPTRTYAPIVKQVLENQFGSISGIIHCSGGGQTKCRTFSQGLHYIKDNLFDTPAIFETIKNNSKISQKEMYQVFNMGHRMEFYCGENTADEIIKISQSFGVEARIVGRVEKNSENLNTNKVTIKQNGSVHSY